MNTVFFWEVSWRSVTCCYKSTMLFMAVLEQFFSLQGYAWNFFWNILCLVRCFGVMFSLPVVALELPYHICTFFVHVGESFIFSLAYVNKVVIGIIQWMFCLVCLYLTHFEIKWRYHSSMAQMLLFLYWYKCFYSCIGTNVTW